VRARVAAAAAAAAVAAAAAAASRTTGRGKKRAYRQASGEKGNKATGREDKEPQGTRKRG